MDTVEQYAASSVNHRRVDDYAAELAQLQALNDIKETLSGNGAQYVDS